MQFGSVSHYRSSPLAAKQAQPQFDRYAGSVRGLTFKYKSNRLSADIISTRGAITVLIQP